MKKQYQIEDLGGYWDVMELDRLYPLASFRNFRLAKLYKRSMERREKPAVLNKPSTAQPTATLL